MRTLNRLFIIALIVFFPVTLRAQAIDSVDVLDYDVSLELSQGAPFLGDATLTIRMLRPCDSIGLELIDPVDSIWVNGTAVSEPRINAIPTTGIAVDDTFTVRVCYTGSGYVEGYHYGGFHFTTAMSYNLGVGFITDPHPIGRAMMPCRDNFHDKATFTLRIHTRPNWTAECSGLLMERTQLDDGTERSVWRIGQPVCTYLVGVSQSKWKRVETTAGGYPATYGYTTQSENMVRQVFAQLDSVVPMFERCFGPYRWDRIGYIATPRGSMEHVHNIALAYQAMESMAESGQNTIAHELAHAWFGNLVTCRTEGDMWFNEGGASFCSEVAKEAVSGRAMSDRYYQTNLESVIRTTHISDDSYLSLSNMPHNHTYGSTTYEKGWMMWHSLRGYLGDSTFYACMRRLMANKAFGTVDAAEVRDSLSLYSGMDLTGFFDFHVLNPGFVDYHVDVDYGGDAPNHVQVTIRQQGVGTHAVAHDTRLPVTFVSTSGEAYKHWFAFHGADTSITLELPFSNPDYHVVDRNLEISDAATVAEINLNGAEVRTAQDAHIRIVRTESQNGSLPVIAVEHHWGRPWDIDTVTGVIRPCGRYWVLTSSQHNFNGIQGQFRYVRSGYTDGNYPHLDDGLCSGTASLDSVALLYREGDGHPWHALSRTHTSTNEGYFTVDNLMAGEYTLAVIDTARMSITSPRAKTRLSLFPNPVKRGESVTIDEPVEGPFTVTITDIHGRKVWQKKGCRSGVKIRPLLPAGTYLVLIENHNVSLQSKLIML